MLQDEEYADHVEISVLLKDLLRNVSSVQDVQKTEVEALAYFQQSASCTHIVGQGYNYILESIHNRKSFVYCLLKALEGFEDGAMMTPNELHFLLG